MLHGWGDFCGEVGFRSSVKLVNGDSNVRFHDENHLGGDGAEEGVEFGGDLVAEFLGNDLGDHCVGFRHHCSSYHCRSCEGCVS